MQILELSERSPEIDVYKRQVQMIEITIEHMTGKEIQEK